MRHVWPHSQRSGHFEGFLKGEVIDWPVIVGGDHSGLLPHAQNQAEFMRKIVHLYTTDELSEVEWNFVTGKRGLFNIIVYETLSGPKENDDLNGVTIYPGDDL